MFIPALKRTSHCASNNTHSEANKVLTLPDKELEEAAFAVSADVDLITSDVSTMGFSVYRNRS